MSTESSAARPFDVVMFDMDGTLVNSVAAIVASYHDATTKLLGEAYPSKQEDIDRIIQMRGQESFPLIARGNPELAEQIKIEFGAAYMEHQKTIPLFPDVEKMLKALQEGGIKLGIATSKARVRFEADMDRVNIRQYFDVMITGDDVEHAKPAPDPIIAGIEFFGVEPSRMLYVGDGANDVIAARTAGARQAGVEFGFHPGDVAAENPDYMLASYLDLIPIVLPDSA